MAEIHYNHNTYKTSSMKKRRRTQPSFEARREAHNILSDPENKDMTEVEILANMLDSIAVLMRKSFIIGVAVGALLWTICSAIYLNW